VCRVVGTLARTLPRPDTLRHNEFHRFSSQPRPHDFATAVAEAQTLTMKAIVPPTLLVLIVVFALVMGR